MDIEILPKTMNIIKLNAIGVLPGTVQKMSGNYIIYVDAEVADRLESKGADLSDPESILHVLLEVARA